MKWYGIRRMPEDLSIIEGSVEDRIWIGDDEYLVFSPTPENIKRGLKAVRRVSDYEIWFTTKQEAIRTKQLFFTEAAEAEGADRGRIEACRRMFEKRGLHG